MFVRKIQKALSIFDCIDMSVCIAGEQSKGKLVLIRAGHFGRYMLVTVPITSHYDQATIITWCLSETSAISCNGSMDATPTRCPSLSRRSKILFTVDICFGTQAVVQGGRPTAVQRAFDMVGCFIKGIISGAVFSLIREH